MGKDQFLHTTNFKALPPPSLYIIFTWPRTALLILQSRSLASLQSDYTKIIYKSQDCEQASESNKQVFNVRGLFCFLSSLIEIKTVWIDLQSHEKYMLCLLPSFRPEGVLTRAICLGNRVDHRSSNISITIATQMAQLSIPVNETQFKQAIAILLVIIMFSRDGRISFLLLHKPARILRGGVFLRNARLY